MRRAGGWGEAGMEEGAGGEEGADRSWAESWAVSFSPTPASPKLH